MPLGGLVPLVLIQIGEVVPGGVGSGLYGIVVFAIIAMFVAGLMVGRTPEYLGKKLEAKEVKMAMLAILIMPVFILGFTRGLGRAAGGARRPRQPGPARLHGNPLCLLVGGRQQRLGLRRPHRQRALVRHDDGHRHAGLPLRHHRAGAWRSPARWRPSRSWRPRPAPSRPTACCSSRLLTGVIVIVSGLEFFPALALGPIVEHFQMLAGKTF